MKIKIMGRQTGKTHMQIEELRRNPDAVLLVHSALERDRLLREHFPGIGPDRIVTLTYVLDGKLRGRRHNIVLNIDNLDLILPWLLDGASVDLVTTTEGEPDG